MSDNKEAKASEPVISAPASQPKIADKIDDETLVINRGTKDSLKVGQRFCVFGYGREILDPDTKESLGRIEIIRGTGVITHVQERIATLKSDMKASPKKTVRRNDSPLTFSVFGQTVEESFSEITLPFDGPQKGDSIRPT